MARRGGFDRENIGESRLSELLPDPELTARTGAGAGYSAGQRAGWPGGRGRPFRLDRFRAHHKKQAKTLAI